MTCSVSMVGLLVSSRESLDQREPLGDEGVGLLVDGGLCEVFDLETPCGCGRSIIDSRRVRDGLGHAPLRRRWSWHLDVSWVMRSRRWVSLTVTRWPHS